MKRRDLSPILLLACLVSSAQAPAAVAQIVVGNGSEHNQMGVGSPVSNDMTGTGDLFMVNDIELGGDLYLEGRIYMERDATSPAEGDQWIYFADGLDRDNEYFGWDDSEDSFLLTNDLLLNGAIETFNGNTVRLRSWTETMTFLLDKNAAIDASSFPHRFTWYNNFELDNSRVHAAHQHPHERG